MVTKHHRRLETVILIVKYGVFPIACWPLPPKSSSSEILKRNVFWLFGLLHLIVACLPSFYNVYTHSDDTDLIVRVAAEVLALITVIAKMIICKVEEPRLQWLLADLQLFVKQATEAEVEILQTYVDRCLVPHSLVLISAVFGPLSFAAGPWVLENQVLPAETAYPFSIEPLWIWTLLYISQTVLVIQVGCMAIVDMMFAMLLWFAGSKFEMLSTSLERAKNSDDVRWCVWKHQELLGYASILIPATRIMAFEVAAMACFSVASAGFVIISNPPLFVLAKFTFFELVAALELFMFTWPADHLIQMSESIGFAAYTCIWIGQCPAMIKNVAIIIQRSQSPTVISINGFLPRLSLEFYGSIMATSFSYLTTLRAMAEK